VKASGGLTYVTGPMGSGKSLFGCRKMGDAFMQGKYVVTNVALRPGWAERIARHTPQVMANPFTFRKRVRLYESLYVFTTELQEATAFRVPGKKESRALLVWDEAHNDANNRDWMEENRKFIVKWATQLRKLGFAGYLLSQHRDNTDAALRRIANFEVRLRNQRESVRVLGMKVSPIPFFLAVWMPANMPKVTRGDQIIHIERYFLSWHKKLYDTLDLYHGLDEDISDLYENVVILPKPGTFTGVERPKRATDATRNQVETNRLIGTSKPPTDVQIIPGPALTSSDRWTRIGESESTTEGTA
jgi:hypothetical protein